MARFSTVYVKMSYFHKLWDRVRKKETKADLSWQFVSEVQIVVLKKDVNSRVFEELMELGYEYVEFRANPTHDHVGNFVLASYVEFKSFCSALAQLNMIPYKNIVRSCLIQHIVYSLMEMGIIDVPFKNVTLASVNDYLNDEAKLTKNEFDLLFRGGLYGEFTIDAVTQLANPKSVQLTKKLSPFPKKSRKTSRLSAPSLQRTDSIVRGRKHWSVSNKKPDMDMSLSSTRKMLMDQWFQKDESGNLVQDPILMMPILKENAILLDKKWYDIQVLKKWINTGNVIVPHSRRMLTQDELHRIKK